MQQDFLSSFVRAKREGSGLTIFNMVCLALATGKMSILTRLQWLWMTAFLSRVPSVLFPVGMGDDDQCIEDDFTAWRKSVWPELDQLLLDEESMAAATPYTAAVLEYRVQFYNQADTSSPLDRSMNKLNGHAVHDAQHPCRANVAVRRELHTPASDRSCTHLEFDISSTGLAYETGDHVGVYTENLIETVEAAERLINISPDTYFSIHSDNEDGTPLSGGSLPPRGVAIAKDMGSLEPIKFLILFI